MSNFTIRIEMHGASDAQYTTLHNKMEAAGYRRFLPGVTSNGQAGNWRMPTAEYDYSGDYTARAVCDHAKAIADTVKLGAWCLVTKAADRAWNTEMLKAAA